MEEATNNLIEKGDQIAKDTTYLKMELTEAVQDVRREGENAVCNVHLNIPHMLE